MRYAGSEQCVEEMLEVFPRARLLTTVVRRGALPAPFARAEPSFLQRIPGASSKYEWLLPLMPLAWRSRIVRDVDAVISSSHACANAVRTDPGTPHLSYCHTPMRYAWDFESEAGRFPAPLRPVARAGMSWFRRWDRETAARVTRFVANSTAVAARIDRFYGRPAAVVHPPVKTDFFTPGGERGDTFLYVGRLVAYKRSDIAVDAFRGLPHQLIVVGEGAPERDPPSNVTFVGHVPDEELRRLYRSARALLAPGVEDFGISMAEAQACGTPVIAPAAGGALDIVSDGATGWLMKDATVDGLRRAVGVAARDELDHDEIHRWAQRFSSARFREGILREVEEMVVG